MKDDRADRIGGSEMEIGGYETMLGRPGIFLMIGQSSPIILYRILIYYVEFSG